MARRFSLESILTMADGFSKPLRKAGSATDAFASRMNKAFGSVNARLDQMQTRMKNTSQEMAPVAMAGMGMVQAGGQISSAGKSILSTFGAIVDEGSAFEKTMSNVAAVSRINKTSQAFKDLEDAAMKLGASTQFSARQVGEGMTFLAMAGFDANQQITAMPDMLKLAQVGNIDLAASADIASNVLGAFKLEAKDMNRVANVMAATMTRSNVNMTQLADTFKYAAPIANAVGMSIEDLAAMTGLLGDVGIQGSQAGTALRAAMVRLAKPPKMAASALEDLGLATMDAQGNLRGLPTILEEIRKKTDKMGTGKRLEAISKIFGTEASAAMADLVSKADKSGKSIDSFAESIRLATKADELSQIASSMADNVEGAGKAFDSAASAVNIGIFNSFKNVWKRILQIGAKILLWLYEFIKNNKTLVKWVSIIAAGIGVVLIVLGSLITMGGIMAGAFVAMSMAAAMFGISLSAAIWPVTLVVVGIIALVAVVALLVAYWEDIMNYFRGTPGIIRGMLAAFTPIISIPLMIAANWNQLISTLKIAWDWFTGIPGAIANAFSNIPAWIKWLIAVFNPFLRIPMLIAANWDWVYAKITAIMGKIGEYAVAAAKFLGIDMSKTKKVTAKARPTAAPPSITERISKQIVDINVGAPPGTTVSRKGKKVPGVTLNLGENGACA